MSATRPYVVRQGDYLAKLAAEVGCSEDEIWEHEKNKELRDEARTKEILAPGDVLHVPDRPLLPQSVSIGAENTWRGESALVPITIRFGEGDRPIAGERYRITGAGDPIEGVSGADGTVAFCVTAHIHSVDVEFPDLLVVHHLRVGHVDPIVTRSGQVSRLRQLGYLGDDRSGRSARDDEFELAISTFQFDQGLTASGAMDEESVRALERAYGC